MSLDCTPDRIERERLAMSRAQLVPIALDETRPCWGRQGDEQCAACTLLQPRHAYGGGFPEVQIIVPHLVEERAGGQVMLICRSRRAAGTHRPAAVCGCDMSPVCAHAHIVRCPADAGNPLESPRQGTGAKDEAGGS